MNAARTVFLMVLITVLLVFMGWLLGSYMGGTPQAGMVGMTVALIAAGVLNFVSYWYSDKIVLKMYKAQPVSSQDAPQLYRIVEELAERGNLPMPGVYIIPTDTPNAFATGRNPSHAAVAVTQGLMRMLDWDEIRGVIAHELSHVRNRDILIGTVAATVAGAIMWLAMIMRFMGFMGGARGRRGGASVLFMLLFSIIAPIAAMLIQMAISRSREFAADEGAAKLSGDPHALANALRKLHNMNQSSPMKANPASAHMFIVNPLSARDLGSLFSTHPDVRARIEKLEALAR